MVKVKTTILALIFLATVIVFLAATPWGGEKSSYSFEPREGARMPESGIGDIGVEIFTLYLFPFEVLALVLLAALIGAIYIARKEIAR